MRREDGLKNLSNAIFIGNKISAATLSPAHSGGLNDKRQKVCFSHARRLRKTTMYTQPQPFNSDFPGDFLIIPVSLTTAYFWMSVALSV